MDLTLLKYLLILIISAQISYCKKYEVNHIKCLVCQRIVEEIQKEVDKVDPVRKVDVGSYRLDSHGEIKKKTVELRKSELFLTEVIEKTCDKMDDYVRATYKSNGQLAVLKLVTDDGKMNPNLQEYDILTDGEIHTLKYHCESVLEEYEDVVMKLFRSGVDNIDIRLCSDSAHFCNETLEEDYTFEEDKDEL